MSTIKKAVILCAGRGTRFYPIASVLPKEMLPLYNKPVLHYIVLEFAKQGVFDICFVVSQNKTSIKDYFANKQTIKDTIQVLKSQNNTVDADELQLILDSCKFDFVYQNDPKGSADALLHAKSFVKDDPFLLSCGDEIIFGDCVMQLTNAYNATSATIIGTKYVDTKDIVKYGVIDVDRQYNTTNHNIVKCKGIVEKPPIEKAPSNMASIGKYAITPNIWDAIKQIKCGSNGEYMLTDALNILCQNKVFACNLDGERYDIGNAEGMRMATNNILKTNCK